MTPKAKNKIRNHTRILIANHIEKAMKENKINQMSMAKVLGISQATISKVLNQKLDFKVSEFLIFTRYFGIDPKSFYVSLKTSKTKGS